MPAASEIHFIARNEGALCDITRCGGVQDLSLVTCQVCLRILQKIKETWAYNPNCIAPPERMHPHRDTRNARDSIVLSGSFIYAKEKKPLGEIQKMLDVGSHRLERIGLRGSTIGGYKLKLDSSQQKSAMILYSEAQKSFLGASHGF